MDFIRRSADASATIIFPSACLIANFIPLCREYEAEHRQNRQNLAHTASSKPTLRASGQRGAVGDRGTHSCNHLPNINLNGRETTQVLARIIHETAGENGGSGTNH